jgi:hypothetical protein
MKHLISKYSKGKIYCLNFLLLFCVIPLFANVNSLNKASYTFAQDGLNNSSSPNLIYISDSIGKNTVLSTTTLARNYTGFNFISKTCLSDSVLFNLMNRQPQRFGVSLYANKLLISKPSFKSSYSAVNKADCVKGYRHIFSHNDSTERFLAETKFSNNPVIESSFLITLLSNIASNSKPAPSLLSSTLTSLENNVPTYGFGNLTVNAKEQNNSLVCQESVQPNQLIHIKGSGFKPNSKVQIYIVSAGLKKSSSPFIVFKSDSSGIINGQLRIPLNASGFPQYSKKIKINFLFVNAIGEGYKSIKQNDIAMLPLYPIGGKCGELSPIPFKGFGMPVENFPVINKTQLGSLVPFKFETPNFPSKLSNLLSKHYPEVAPISCSDIPVLNTGKPLMSIDNDGFRSYFLNWLTDAFSNFHIYLLNTSQMKTGCYEFVLKLIDNSYHRAVFELVP